MKNVVRALALALVATCAFASAHSNSAKIALSPRNSAIPVPTCPPSDPTGCGICQFSGNCN